MEKPLMDSKSRAVARFEGAAEYVKNELAREPEKKRLTLAQAAKRGLIWFFSIMLALTFISRMADEALVAKVSVKGVGGGALDKSVTGKGEWTAADAVQQRAEFTGLRLDRIFVRAGDSVSAGDPLYCYDMGAIEDKLKELEDKLEQYGLRIKQLKTGRSDSAESAELTLSQAQRELAAARSKLDGAAAKIAEDKRKAYDDALFAYQSKCAQRASELASAEQAVTAAQAALNLSDPATQTALNDVQAALNGLNDQWNYSLAEPQRTLAKAQEEWNRVQNGTYDYSSGLSSYRDAIASAQRALETAQLNYERAKESDGDANANIKYQIQSIELDMATVQQQIDELTALAERNGEVCADAGGIVTAVNGKAGSVSTGEAVAELTTGGLVLTALLPADDAKQLRIGDRVTLTEDGKPKRDELTVAKIGLPDASGQCSIICTDNTAGSNADRSADNGAKRTLGGREDFTIEKKTQKQNVRIPIQALRENGMGEYFVLVMGTEETVLGTRDIAVSVPVTLIDHDEQYAAVDGGISGGSRLIISSSKQIAAGDRVAVRDE